ncbi:SNARE domain-containing protein [Ditylenchus destructor]|nr:SNARE domain-containing protein [Ditylenchus destructor]
MDWTRAKFILDRFESMSKINLKELKQHYRRIQQLEEDGDHESSVIEKNNANRLIDQILEGLKQILALRKDLNTDCHDSFDSRIEPIRLQIQGMVNTFKIQLVKPPQNPRENRYDSSNDSNMFDDCFSNAGYKNNSIYEEQFQTQETINPRLQELKMKAEQSRMDAEATEKLSQDINDLNQVMTDLAQLVHSQHDLVDSIEEHVERTTHEVQQGHQNLKKAVNSKNAAAPLLGAAVGGMVLGGPVGIAAGSTIAGVAAAVAGAFGGLYGGRLIKKQVNKEANRES